MVKRGLTEETIHVARLGSVRSQADLELLGVDCEWRDLQSTIVIPYGPPDAHGLCHFRLHKRSLRDFTYPPYTVLPRRDVDRVIIAEAEFKALAAWQLGYNAIALQGLHSFVSRMNELVQAVRELGCTHVAVCLDTVQDITNEWDLRVA